MYCNLTQYPKYLEPEDLFYLISLKQVMLLEIPLKSLERFNENGLTTHIKGKKGQTDLEKLRLSEKGKKLLTTLSFTGAVDEESANIRDWLVNFYKSKKGGIVKNKVELGRRIHWWKNETQIKGNFLALLIKSAMNDMFDSENGQTVQEFMESNPRGILSNLAENLLWTPSSHFDKHYSLDKSPLYAYFEDNEEYIKKLWETYLFENGEKR